MVDEVTLIAARNVLLQQVQSTDAINRFGVEHPVVASNLVPLLGIENVEDFVCEAYLSVLDRRPEVDCSRSAIELLKNGKLGRVAFLEQLANSPEGKARGVKLAGIELLKRLRRRDSGITERLRRFAPWMRNNSKMREITEELLNIAVESSAECQSSLQQLARICTELFEAIEQRFDELERKQIAKSTFNLDAEIAEIRGAEAPIEVLHAEMRKAFKLSARVDLASVAEEYLKHSPARGTADRPRLLDSLIITDDAGQLVVLQQTYCLGNCDFIVKEEQVDFAKYIGVPVAGTSLNDLITPPISDRYAAIFFDWPSAYFSDTELLNFGEHVSRMLLQDGRFLLLTNHDTADFESVRLTSCFKACGLKLASERYLRPDHNGKRLLGFQTAEVGREE